MKRTILFLLCLMLFLVGCATTDRNRIAQLEKDLAQLQQMRQLEEDIRAASYSGAKWSTYASLGSGNIADGDDFMVRDISDTSPWATGEQKLYTWSNLKTDLAAISEFEFPNANDTTSVVDAQAEAGHDNNNPGIAVHDNSNVRYYATRTKCLETVVLAEPDQLQPIADVWTLIHFPAEQYPAGFVVEAIHISTSATCTDVLVFEEWSNNGTSWTHQNDVESITLSGTYTEDDGTLAHDTINADYYLRVDLPASPTDIASYEVTICGQIPVNN